MSGFRRFIRLIATSTAVAAPVLGIAVPAPVAPVAAAAERTVGRVLLNGYEAALVADINAARARHGLRRLVVAPGTTDVARRWARHLARVRALSHNQAIVRCLEHAGSRAWTDIAENVGEAPAKDPQALFDAYMASPPHRANILDPVARYVGVGVVERAGTAWNTLDFTNAYSWRYGRTRVPAAALTMDRRVITRTTDVASLERPDQRFGVIRRGSVRMSPVRFTGPSRRNDSAYVYLRRAGARRGSGDLLMRDALDLRHAGSLVLQVCAHDRRRRAVAVRVLLARAYGRTVYVGTVRATARARWVNLRVPPAARTFRTRLVLRVGARTITVAGGLVRLDLFDVRIRA